MIQADEVFGILRIGIHIRVYLGSQTKIAWMKGADNPEGVIAERDSYLRIGKICFPSERQPAKLAPVQTVQCIHHVYWVKPVLACQSLLVGYVGARFAFSHYTLSKFIPGDIVLEQDEIRVLIKILVMTDALFIIIYVDVCKLLSVNKTRLIIVCRTNEMMEYKVFLRNLLQSCNHAIVLSYNGKISGSHFYIAVRTTVNEPLYSSWTPTKYHSGSRFIKEF